MTNVNVYVGSCETCKAKVEPYEGSRRAVDGNWKIYCANCKPFEKPVRKLSLDGHVIVPYEPSNLNLIRAMPGANWFPEHKGGPYWQVSLDSTDRLRVLEIADILKLDVDPALREGFSTNSLVEEAKKNELLPFQLEGVNWLSRRIKGVLADDMGLGKTLEAIFSLDDNAKVLVICPSISKYHWQKEIFKWRPEFYTHVVDQKKEFRLPIESEIVIVSYDTLPEEDILKKATFQEIHLIIDELHNVKNISTKRHKKVKAISKTASKVWGLTGSFPYDKSPADLYGMLGAMNMAYEQFGNWDKFVKLFNGRKNEWGAWCWGNPEPIVGEILKKFMFRRMKEDVMPELPVATYTDLYVPYGKTELTDLDVFWEKHGSTIQKGSLPPFTEFSKIREKLAKSRIPVMLQFMEECEWQNVPLIVFSSHLAPLTAIYTRPGWEILDGSIPPAKRQEIVDKFQAGKLKGLGVSLMSCGSGINLSYAWKVLFVDQDWSPAKNEQAVDRVIRIGQQNNAVDIVRFVGNHVLDEHLNNILLRKTYSRDSALKSRNVSN